MKLSRSELKNIIKECLIEIFQESFFEKIENKKVGFEKPKVGFIKQNENFKSNSPKSLMEELLSDTAQTTLKSQNMAERNSSKVPTYHDKMSQIVDQTSPEDIFGNESAAKWEKLVFFDQKNK